MRKAYYCLVLLFYCSYSFAQGWEKTYTAVEYSYDYWNSNVQRMTVCSDNGYIFVGTHWNSSPAVTQGMIVKTDPAGNVSWSIELNDTCGLIPKAVIESGSGYLVSGQLLSHTPASFLTQLDYSGNILWSKYYDASIQISMMQPVTGGIILMGTCTAPLQGISVSKVDINGNLLWNKSIPGNRIYAEGMAMAENNSFIVAGVQEIGVWGDEWDCYLMKFDSTGALMWNRSYGYAPSFAPHVIKRTYDGNFIICGRMFMKVTTNGDILWVKQLNWGSPIKDICERADHGFIALASDDWGIPDETLFYRIDADGNKESQRVMGGQYDNDFCLHLLTTGCIIAGYNSSSPGHSGFYLKRTDSLGNTGCNIFSSYYYYPNYAFGAQQCVVNNPAFTQTSNTGSGSIPVLASPFAVITDDPCCHAQAIITPDGYSYPFCQGDSLHFSGNGAPHLLWSTGDTTRNIVTMDTVVYLTATNTCGSFYDTIEAHPGSIPPLSFSLSSDTICPGDSAVLVFHDSAPNHFCYGGVLSSPGSSTYILKPDTITTYHAGSVTSIMGPGCSTTQSFTIYPDPPKPFITKVADTLFSSSVTSNQWFLNGNMISGATSRSLMISAGGVYSVKMTGIECANYSDDFPTNRDTVIPGSGWQKVIRSAQGGTAVAVVQADDGNFVVAGNFYLPGGQKITLVQTDGNGGVMWSKEYGAAGLSTVSGLIKVSGGYLLVGSTNCFGNGANDVYVIRVDLSGNVIWSKTYGDWNDQSGSAVIQTSDGNFVIVASTIDPHIFTTDSGGWPVNENDIYLIRIDGAGNTLWNKRIDAADGLGAFAIQETAAGALLISATTNENVLICQTDASGNLQWNTIIHNSHYMVRPALIVTPDNNIIMCSSGYDGTSLLKLDATGSIVWSKRLEAFYFSDITATSDNNLLIVTKSETLGNDMVTKMDLNGNLIWSNIFENLNSTSIARVIQLSDGSFLMAGTFYTPAGAGQIYLVNTGAAGKTNCTESNSPLIPGQPVTSSVTTLQASSFGNEMNAGTITYNSIPFTTDAICTSIPYMIGIQEQADEIRCNVYPNPGSGIFNVEYHSEDEECLVHVYDLSGRCVYFDKKSRTSTFQVDLSTLTTGVYFIELLGKRGRAVSRIIKQ